jgi:hypothetical protein
MRASAITSILVFCLGLTSATTEIEYAPFGNPNYDLTSSSLTNSTAESDDPPPLELFRRQQGSCPASYNGCTEQNAAGACCKVDTVCSMDDVGHVACCPTSAVCTGTINVGTQSGSVGSTTSSGFLAPVSTTSSGTAQATVQETGGGTTISNEFYNGFVVLPTSFPNAQDCSSAISSCTSEFQKCTAALGGNQNGVTITGNGASVTVQGATTNLGPSATSICQSLSSKACRGSQLANCNGGTATGGAGSLANVPNAAPTPVVPVGFGLALGVGAAVGVRVMRQVL